MARSELFHVCIVVPDIEAARPRLSELLGLEWGPLRGFPLPFEWTDGTDVLATRFQVCYSLAAPHIELIAEQPGTPWVCNEHSNLHHIGYLVDDMGAGAQRLTATACPLEVLGRDTGSGVPAWAYHRDQLGVRLEIVNAAMAGAVGDIVLGRPVDAPVTTPF